MTNAKIAQESQEPAADPTVHLFSLDASGIGGDVYFFTSTVNNGSAIIFDGQPYTPIAIEAKGFEWNGQGALPTPTIRLEKVTTSIKAILRSTNNLQGAVLTRIRTFRKFLDDGSDPDPLAIYSQDIYRIERLIGEGKTEVELELSAYIDQHGRRIGYQMLRDYCPLIYRNWDLSTGQFDYTKATCPYTGDNYFRKDGSATTNPAEDEPAKTLNRCCRVRFGDAPLPFGGFPGLARVRN